ncbi:hypothetical protein [Microbacterium kyungheense]|uniref:Uncharacterized protein n=1 Tax=Microbacterium kyungheense TaxID=1263636 RepID=A0A543FKH3_9MICO|nr:hypothetical protein [Microbacterium kyungheense]TQM34363.1 hypothetical protein FB391_0650 [Microbacterium kyungheense]
MTQPSETPTPGDAASSGVAASRATAPGPGASGPGASVPAAPEVPTAPGADAGATVRDARLTWLVGGSLLIARAALVLLANGNAALSFPGMGFVLDGLWAAALVVFAFGVRGQGSVVARRPLGVVALVVAAAMPLLSDIWWAVFPIAVWDGAVAFVAPNATTVLLLGALIVATVVIGRAGAVPHRARWVPLIVLAVAAGAQIVVSIIGVSLRGNFVGAEFIAATFFASALGTLGVLLLGILAIVSAPREAPRPAAPTQVFPPAD